MSAPAAFVAAGEPPRAATGALEARVAALEDEIELRRLAAKLVQQINGGSRDVLEAGSAELREIVAADVEATCSSAVIPSDRRAARVRLPCTVCFDEPIDAPGSSLVDMARLQGEGVLPRLEARMLEAHCERTGGRWRLVSARLLEA
jgi:hypothetical protein